MNFLHHLTTKTRNFSFACVAALLACAMLSTTQAQAKTRSRHGFAKRAQKFKSKKKSRLSAKARHRDPDALPLSLRRAYIGKADVWQNTDTSKKDLFNGPRDSLALNFDQALACDFVKVAVNSKHPRFYCKLDTGRVVSVSYGKNNPEVYSQVLGTRLLWALGFGADTAYPVRIVCRNCPAQPFSVTDARKHILIDEHGKARPMPSTVKIGTMTFYPATIVEPYPGTGIDSREGWGWDDLSLVSARAGGASRAQIDALKLLAVLMQHATNGPSEQRLTCLRPHSGHQPASVLKDPAACEKAFLYIEDLSSSFAGGGPQAAQGLVPSVQAWATTPIWKDAKKCRANLTPASDEEGGLQDPVISEAGRLQLLALLKRLDPSQVEEMFMASRVALRKEKVRTRSGKIREATVSDWTRTFWNKVAQIENVNNHAGCPL
jgi:hypothetical protein